MATVVDRVSVLKKPHQKHWISYIKQRIQKNKNFLGFISGQTGSGKSWSSLSIGEELDPEFNIDRVVFGGLELMNLINSGKLSRGSVIVFEEMGVEMSNKNWQSVTNKMLNYLIQTFRHRGFILIMNSPYMDFVDSSTRKLFHAEMQTVGIDFKKKQVKLKPQNIQYNPRMAKFYYHRLKVIKPLGKVPVTIWKVNKPSDKLIKEYEKKKLAYTTKLNLDIYDKLKAKEEKDKLKGKKPLTEKQQEWIELWEKGLNVQQIAEKQGIALKNSYQRRTGILNKGYSLEKHDLAVIHRDNIKV